MRCAALLIGSPTLLDHLGVLSHHLEVPLFVTNEHAFSLAQKFYPMFDMHFIDLQTLTIEYISHHWDVLFVTGKFFAQEMQLLFTAMQRSPPRIIYCPHGNSDKGRSLTTHSMQDISLFYGDHMKNLLEETGATKQLRGMIRTGNYRLPFYLRHKKFYDALAEEALLSLPQDKPLLLYAPTWADVENPSPFFKVIDPVIEILSPTYNIVVLLHPLMREDHPANLMALTSRYEEKKEVLFLEDFPAIYPLLARCIAYLGDYSSIGYDALAMDCPIYFLLEKEGLYHRKNPIFSCGTVLNVNDLVHIETWIQEDNKSAQRRALYQHVFGDFLDAKCLQTEIWQSLGKKCPSYLPGQT